MDELGRSAKLVVNGSNFLGAGTAALGKIGAAKSFSDRRSSSRTLMASGELKQPSVPVVLRLLLVVPRPSTTVELRK